MSRGSRASLIVAALLAASIGTTGCRAPRPPRPTAKKPARSAAREPHTPPAEHRPEPADRLSHGGKLTCSSCHVLHGGGMALLGDPGTLCTRCHKGMEHASHPVDVQQKKPLPADLPLGDGNKLLCQTCHDPHKTRKHGKGLRLHPNELCLRCHQK